MSTGLMITIAVLVAIVLELLLLLLWVMTEALLVSWFRAPKSIESDFFKERKCMGIPYILDKGVPYKGSIDSITNVRLPMNEGYKFAMDSNLCSYNGLLGDTELVNLPHCYNTMEGAYRDYRGDVWYEKTFEYKIIKDKPVVRLTFMGSFLKTDVWLDGNHLGTNEEGYLPFTFDISNITEGKHKLVIKVNNLTSTETLPISLFKGHKPGWHHYSGIHKEVFIEYLPEVSVFKLACIPLEKAGKWSLNTSILLERSNITKDTIIDCNLKIKGLTDRNIKVHFPKGEKVGGASLLIDVEYPTLWTEVKPYLYTLEVKTPYEESSVKFGFRKISWGEGKININNKQVFLRGVCRHEDSGEMGHATNVEIIDKELKLMAEGNCNFVRLAHYPHSKATLDITDNMGMYVWSEIPFYQAGHAITHDTFGKEFGYVKIKNFSFIRVLGNFRKTSLVRDKKLLTIAAQSLVKLVERDINHPSIITWGVGNEVWSVNKAAGKALGWLREVVRRYDTSRAVNYAAMSMPVLTNTFESSFKHMDWACVNEYFGWYYGKIDTVGKLVMGIYKKCPNKPLVITETGSDTKYGLRDNEYPPKDKYSEDYQKYFLEETWKNLLKSPAFSGLSVWVFKDFACPEYGANNPVPFYNMKGLFDKDMNEKISYKTLSDLYSTKKYLL